ncbi:MAG: hypothetical protein QOH37_1517 [Nocardioidaceae bacterium]|jgi:hypothetical protein|nr:hypothetical protein [Nocardioidaceae bacterium]
MTGIRMRGRDNAPVTVNRRTLLRTAAWATPVVLVVAAAPAMAASAPAFPLLITAMSAGSGGNSTKVLMTFSGGTGLLTLNFVQLNGNGISIGPNSLAANGGEAIGGGQTYQLGGSYTVNYTYQGTTFTQPVVGT